MIYGKGQMARPIPVRFNPSDIMNGKMSSFNGGISAAGILMGFIDDHRSAQFCSAISTYAYNNTNGGHGGNFWNNFWTPLGAHQHSKEAFIYFWKNHRWYRECSRMYDGSLIGGGRQTAGYGVALVAPRRRIQIVGAPPSPFAVDSPDILNPALEAYFRQDYAGCEKITNKLIASGTVSKDELPTVEYLARAAADMSASIDADLARINAFINAGDPAKAQTFLAGLEGVMPEGDKRLVALQERLAKLAEALKGKKPAADEPKKADNMDLDLARIKALIDAGDREAAITYLESLQAADKGDPRLIAMRKRLDGQDFEEEAEEDLRQWECLVLDRQFKDPKKIQRKRKGPWVTSNLDKANTWSIKILESMNQAPNGWSQPRFDDSNWLKTDLPTSWRMYHTALLRTKFDVADKDKFDALRVHAWVLRQQGLEIYLNGELIGKINGVGKTTTFEGQFKQSALKHLKNGENTLAIKTRHNWRWGRSFMYVYNEGFDFNLDARLKEVK